MDILQKDDGKRGVFYVEQDGKILAEMLYTWTGTDKIIISHTEVNDVLAGKGIGKQLVQKAVDMAREQQIKIIPLCPFAKSVFDRVAAFSDVLF